MAVPNGPTICPLTTQPLVFVELRCPLDGDVPASAAIFRRRPHIPRTSLVAAPAPCIPPRPPRNHPHETGEMTRRDGETASWRRGGGCISAFFFAQLARSAANIEERQSRVFLVRASGVAAELRAVIAARGSCPFWCERLVRHGPWRRRVGPFFSFNFF